MWEVLDEPPMIATANGDTDTSFHESWYLHYGLYWGVHRKVEMNGGCVRAIASRLEKRESRFGLHGWVIWNAKIRPQSGKMKCGVVPITANEKQGFVNIVIVRYVKLEDLEYPPPSWDRTQLAGGVAIASTGIVSPHNVRTSDFGYNPFALAQPGVRPEPPCSVLYVSNFFGVAGRNKIWLCLYSCRSQPIILKGPLQQIHEYLNIIYKLADMLILLEFMIPPLIGWEL